MAQLERDFPAQQCDCDGATVSYRSCGHGPVIVLLHGIGSGAASWLACALALAPTHHVIAWDAPGYGDSSPLAAPAPSAADYAQQLHALLAALAVDQCVLVGHSLGAIMAAAFADAHPAQVARLVLLSPAHGYGGAARQARGREVAQARLEALAQWGIDGIAQQRAAHMLSARASDGARAWVRWNMAQLHPGGYTQAVHMLCSDSIERYHSVTVNGSVACGDQDSITTPADSAALAQARSYPYFLIEGAGHACQIEQPAAVAAAIKINGKEGNQKQ